MTQSEVADILRMYQSEYKVDKVVYNEKPVWPILRYYLALVLLIPKSSEKSPKVEEDTFLKPGSANFFKDLIQRLVKKLSFFEWPLLVIKGNMEVRKFRKSDSSVLFISPSFEPYPDKIEGKKYSRYLDPYFEICEKETRCAKVQLTDGRDTMDDEYIRTLKVNEQDLFKKIVIETKIKSRIKKNSAHSKFYKELHVLNEFSRRKNINFIFQTWLVNHLDEVEVYRKLFTKLIKGSSVKAIYFEAYYSPCLFGLVASCKELGVKTIDIQHGVVDINYLAWENVPAQLSFFLPDYYWVWSSSDLSLLNHKRIKPIVGGNMWMGKFVQKKVKNNIKNFNEPGDRPKRIMVSLQFGSGYMEYLTNLIKELLTTSGKSYQWFFRFHPLSGEAERQLFIETLEIFDNCNFDKLSALNLYEAFGEVDVHLVGSSAVALEGIQFSLPTIIVHPIGIDLFEKLIGRGVMCGSLEIETILDYIENFRPSKLPEEYRIETSEIVALRTIKTILNQTSATCAA